MIALRPGVARLAIYKKGKKNMNDLLMKISELIGANLWLAPVLALCAGVLTSFTPCSLSTIPLVIGCIGGMEEHQPKKAFRLSLTFALGSMLTFTALGVAASLLGELLYGLGPWLHLILGLILVLMALQMFGVFELVPEARLFGKNTKKGYAGTFLAGLLAGAFSSHCTTPVLIAMLAIVANRASLLFGVLLLVIFSVGHGVLSVVAGTSAGLVKKLMADPQYHRMEKLIRVILGVVIALAAAYLLYEAFSEGFLEAVHTH